LPACELKTTLVVSMESSPVTRWILPPEQPASLS
jgi:hypothetical protein